MGAAYKYGRPRSKKHKILTMVSNTNTTRPDLDQSYYSKLTPEKLAFFKSQAHIDDDEKLKEHLLSVQEKSYKV